MTDHRSTEGSREVLATAVRRLTGREPVLLDAGPFLAGGGGRAERGPAGELLLEVPGEGRRVAADTLLVYEIPPHRRRAFEGFQHRLRGLGARSLGTDAGAWRAATEKDLTVRRLAEHGIPQMPSITLSRPDAATAAEAFERLGRDVWARPTVGMGGGDVFHLTTDEQLATAARHYAATGTDWLIARDAGNLTPEGARHQYRVVVLEGRVVRAVEHVQADPDAPCNECRGAVSTLLRPGELPSGLDELAIAATEAVGLPLAGVDLAAEQGGVVFEVNVHPVFGTVGGLETVAVPYVTAHLALPA